jgi:hypothetical protein
MCWYSGWEIHAAQQGQNAGMEADSWTSSSRAPLNQSSLLVNCGFLSFARHDNRRKAMDWSRKKAGDILR